MRKLLLPAIVAMVGVLLVVAPPSAVAGKRHWHTVMKFYGAHVQACRGKNHTSYYRVNNKHGHRWGTFKFRGTVNGKWVRDGSSGYFGPLDVTSLIGGTYFAGEVDHLKVRLDKNRHHPRQVKKRKIRPGHIGRC